MSGRLPQRASFYYIKDNKMVDYFPTDETVGAFVETATSIISAVCAERIDPTPATRPAGPVTLRIFTGCKKREGSERSGYRFWWFHQAERNENTDYRQHEHIREYADIGSC